MANQEISAERLLFDERMGVHTVFVSVARRDWVFVKLLVESYEGLGVTRTLERYATDLPARAPVDEPGAITRDSDAADSGVGPGEDLMVLMAVPDMVEVTVSVLAYLAEECDLRLIYPNEAYRRGFRDALLAELDS